MLFHAGVLSCLSALMDEWMKQCMCHFKVLVKHPKTLRWGIGADYGMLTILKTVQVGGLQIRLDGTWIDVDPIEGAFIINIGEHCMFMTVFAS